MAGSQGMFGSNGTLNGSGWPNPFVDVASSAMPASFRSALYWAEFLMATGNGTYAAAADRIVSYFLTDIDFKEDSEASDKERDDWTEFLKDDLGIMPRLYESLMDRWGYGNSFTSLLVPFVRFLTCPRCGEKSIKLSEVYHRPEFHFAWNNLEFNATCPGCSVGSGYTGPFRIDDRPGERKGLIFKRWSPHQIEILHDYFTDQCHYLWRIPEDYKQQIRKGHLFHLERVSQPILESIKRNQMFRFEPDAIYHMKEPTLAGVLNRGWGIPRSLRLFRQLYYVQVLRRYNEAIALDYVVPFRLLTPAPRPGAGGSSAGGGIATDPLMLYNMTDFRSQAERMIRQHGRRPTDWHVFPFPVQYQILGGDASKLAPVELIDNGESNLLNAMGTPVELYKGTLTMQTALPALRLFESQNRSMVHEANGLLRWLVKRAAMALSWAPVKPELRPVTMVDDMQKIMMLQQLFTGQQVSGETAFQALGQDWKKEQRRIGSETLYTMQQQAKIQEEAATAGFAQQLAKGNVGGAGGGAAPQGGAGGAPAAQGAGAGGASPGQPGQPGQPVSAVDQFIASSDPRQPQSPEDLVQAAGDISTDLLGRPLAERRQKLQLLKQNNPAVYALVLQGLKQTRQQASSVGRQQVLQQQGMQP